MAKRARNAAKAVGGGKSAAGDSPVGDYRHHGVKQKNNPPAKVAAEGVVPGRAPPEPRGQTTHGFHGQTGPSAEARNRTREATVTTNPGDLLNRGQVV